ncbi:hypothetical protein P3T37_003075 [Kitasatospora sp. MAA4]|nr:hypothetical protein [Kitasatospora sp. MAA4]
MVLADVRLAPVVDAPAVVAPAFCGDGLDAVPDQGEGGGFGRVRHLVPAGLFVGLGRAQAQPFQCGRTVPVVDL